MRLAKQALDIGLFTDQPQEQRAFWEADVGLTFDGMLKLGGGVHQQRFRAREMVIKVNHSRYPISHIPQSGIRSVSLAIPRAPEREFLGPDGQHVRVVPAERWDDADAEIDLVVRDMAAHDRFWHVVMQFERFTLGTYACGRTRLRLRDGIVGDAAETWKGLGWRYLTVQVEDCYVEHRGALERGGAEGQPPQRMGDVAIVSFVRDPDGNFIELSQRASLVGRL